MNWTGRALVSRVVGLATVVGGSGSPGVGLKSATLLLDVLSMKYIKIIEKISAFTRKNRLNQTKELTKVSMIFALKRNFA